MIIKRISPLIALGLGSGALGTILLRRVVTSVLFIRYDRDGIVIAGLVVLMALVALLSSIIPALRAAKVDPMVALRYE